MGLSCAAGRRPVRQRVVGDNRNGAQWGRAGRGWLVSLERDRVTKWCFIGDEEKGGGKRTYSYSTAPDSDKGEKMGLVPFFDYGSK